MQKLTHEEKLNLMKNLDLEDKYLQMTQDILRKRFIDTNVKAYIFGSRAKGAAKKTSDIDLALDNDGKKLDYFKTLGELQNDFEESDIKYSADIIDLNDISESFKKRIINYLKEINYQSAV
ncbi:MAG: nucleotidyltransferase domain-containing protein [Elusimicrobiota bacterium]|jgi:predicted nucleotidyltransferase|nr:nucleotidyltransferase domain-containing protein [Elusimicrobiota bacterium]